MPEQTTYSDEALTRDIFESRFGNVISGAGGDAAGFDHAASTECP
jgi:hypothetical protein